MPSERMNHFATGVLRGLAASSAGIGGAVVVLGEHYPRKAEDWPANVIHEQSLKEAREENIALMPLISKRVQ